MIKQLIITFLLLLISFGAWAAGPAIFMLRSHSATYSKILATPSGYLLATASGYLVRTPATENWNKLLVTSDGKIIVTPSGYAIKVN